MQFRDLGERFEIIPETPEEEKRLRRIMGNPFIWWTMDGGEEGNQGAMVIVEMYYSARKKLPRSQVGRKMIEIGLFVDGEHKDTMERKVVPRVGETIVIDCGEMVKVTEVSHQWDGDSFVQVNTVEMKQ